MTEPRIIVIGGGILGLSIGAELASLGANVQILVGLDERASDGSLVWLNVISTETEDYARLRVASMRGWADWQAQDGCPVVPKGALLWDRDAAALQALSSFQTGVGWETTLIDRAAFATLAPGIAAPPDCALFAPSEASADPADVMHWAAMRAMAAGADIQSGEVAAITQTNGRANGVKLADGSARAADHVIIAAGNGSATLLAPFGIDAGLKDAPGMLLRTKELPPLAGPILASPGMDFWQGDDGRVYLATGTDRTMVDDLHGSAAAALEALAALMPAAGDAKIDKLMLRNRPIPGDGLPVVGAVPGVGGLSMALTHSGMTLAPIIARGIAAAVLGRDEVAELAPFGPARMTKGPQA